MFFWCFLAEESGKKMFAQYLKDFNFVDKTVGRVNITNFLGDFARKILKN